MTVSAGNVKNRPAFAGEPRVAKEEEAAFYEREALERRYLQGYELYDKRQLRKMTHLERVKNETGMYRTISENYDKQRKREHEHKNQMAFIAALARSNKIDEINHYLKEYNEE